MIRKQAFRLATVLLLVVALFTSNILSAFAATWTQQTGSPSRHWSALSMSGDGTKLTVAIGASGLYSGGIYYSTDSGVTWTQSDAPTKTWTSIAASEDGETLIASAQSSPIFYSTDSGVTWASSTSGVKSTYDEVAISSDGTKAVAISSAGGAEYIYYSSDSGVTWATSTSDHGAWRNVTMSGDGQKVAAIRGGSSYVYISTDSGATWATSTASGLQSSRGDVKYSRDGEILYSNYTTTLQYSEDDGASWSSVTAPNGFLAVSGNGQVLMSGICCNADLPSVSLDYGATWTVQTGAGTSTRASAISSDGTKMAFAGGGYLGFAHHVWTGVNDFPAEISDIEVVVTDTTATITWETDEPADSQVEYGATDSYTESSTLDTNMVTSHSVTLTGLTPETTYHFSVRSTDAGDNLSTSDDDTFTTTATPIEEEPQPQRRGSSGSRRVVVPVVPNTPSEAELLAMIESLKAQIQQLLSGGTPVATFARSLNLGMSGADVTALQTFLISKGYLAAGNTTGFFGNLTKQAVIDFQKAQGIEPAVGFFGPVTQAKVKELSQ